MTKEQFLKDFNYAPYDLEEVARITTKITDDDIAIVAKKFLKAQCEFEEQLESIGYETG